MSAARALARLALAHARRRRLQSALMVFGVALGVSVVVAIELANDSALAAFRISTEAVSGRATHRIVGGPSGLDQAIYTRLRTDPAQDVRASAPVVEGRVLVAELGGVPMTLLGLDPFAEPPFRSFFGGAGVPAGAAGATTSGGDVDARAPADVDDLDTGTGPPLQSATGDPSAPPLELLGALLARRDSVLVARDVAARAGLGAGDQLTLDVGGRREQATIVGILDPPDELSRRALDGLVLSDIGVAQRILGRQGRLDRIDLMLPADEAESADVLARLGRALPPGVALVPAGERQATAESMTAAFRANLLALSLLALFVGAFLIFNTVRFSVVQRRPTIATLRALGVTRREIFAAVVGETLALGALGAAIGIGLGIVLGRGAVVLVTQTVNDLFFTVTVRGVDLRPAVVVRGGVLGVAAAGLAAILPAWEATSVSPLDARRRVAIEAAARAAVPRTLATAAASAALGAAILAIPSRSVPLGFAALGALVFAFALTAPATTLGLMAAARPIAGRLFGLLGRMAPRDVSRSLSRTAVAIAALMVALCVSIGVGVMVGSFRITVERWLADTLVADIFISAPGGDPAGGAGDLDPLLVERLRAVPEVERVATARRASVRSARYGPVDVLAFERDIAGDGRSYQRAIGSNEEVAAALRDGAISISEPLSRRLSLTVGDELELETDVGRRRFPIVGVFADYGSQTGIAFMADPVYRAAWPDDDRLSSVALQTQPGVDGAALARRLERELLAEGVRLDIQPTGALRAAVLEVFDRAFAITTALQGLAILIAFVGVLSALLSLQLERAREQATLRAIGFTRRQLAGLSLLQTGLMGGVAGVLSWPAGLTLALVLIYVINRRSFGWTIETHLAPEIFVRALALAVAAALLAGIYPAYRLSRRPIAGALREE